MKTVRFHKIGGPEVLIYEEVPTPSPKAGEVLIKIEAVGLNYADVMRRRGDDYPVPSPIPFTLGAEVAGIIEAVGEGVVGFTIGMPVFATPGEGGYAEYISIPASIVIPLPEGLDFVKAAALVAHGLTAVVALRHAAKLQPGETVLVEGAAGGLGSFMVQLAKLYGARVVAAASSREKREIAKKLGADFAVDYTQSGWVQEVREFTNGKGVDIVLETTGGEVVNQALDAMADFGRMIYIGQSSGQSSTIDPWRLTSNNQTVSGIYIGSYATRPGFVTEVLSELFSYLAQGKISIEVGSVLPLYRAVEAHKLFETRKNIGKIVLIPSRNE